MKIKAPAKRDTFRLPTALGPNRDRDQCQIARRLHHGLLHVSRQIRDEARDILHNGVHNDILLGDYLPANHHIPTPEFTSYVHDLTRTTSELEVTMNGSYLSGVALDPVTLLISHCHSNLVHLKVQLAP